LQHRPEAAASRDEIHRNQKGNRWGMGSFPPTAPPPMARAQMSRSLDNGNDS
jgi:hypothetical protein